MDFDVTLSEAGASFGTLFTVLLSPIWIGCFFKNPRFFLSVWFFTVIVKIVVYLLHSKYLLNSWYYDTNRLYSCFLVLITTWAVIDTVQVGVAIGAAINIPLITFICIFDSIFDK